ncbi:predicted protein [Chaetomium globosum CBS 148.51]|uniref:Uncharacterized protein n=1 Tax=Chaetomium globosum (strain ATCC 6205 / CBS 148.51 / DSM 1962 / NBRC 6347 / NRRL 1970) TaxID=306901 RepID=Q2H4J7_CHAGB|nr:uncharacterized protein CHGG_06418 [Chaetomium globosum CBS 148.51]EAQ89799.1 predicted protein [Chaetomium globosum CBS 148.51]
MCGLQHRAHRGSLSFQQPPLPAAEHRPEPARASRAGPGGTGEQTVRLPQDSLTGEPSPGEPATHTGIRFVVRFKTQEACHPLADFYPVTGIASVISAGPWGNDGGDRSLRLVSGRWQTGITILRLEAP